MPRPTLPPLTVEQAQQFIYVPDGDDPSLPIKRKKEVKGSKVVHGSRYSGRYRQVTVDGRLRLVSHVVWTLHFGEIPEGLEIDHIDRNKLNNRAENLRVVTRSDNSRNQRVGGKTSRFRGVVFSRAAKKYQANLYVNGTLVHLGLFHNEEDAAATWDAAISYVFGPYHWHPTNANEGLLPGHTQPIELPEKVKARLDRAMAADKQYRDQPTPIGISDDVDLRHGQCLAP